MSNELYELKKEELKKDWKSTAYQYGISLIVFELISGTVLLFSKKILWFEQFLLLFHMLLGFLLIVSIVAFYFRLKLYLKIWNGHKRSALLGWSTLFCFGISFFTGAILFFTGVTGLSSLRLLHLISSFIFTVFFFSFIALVIFSLSPKSNERQQKAFFKMLRLITLRVVLFFSLIWGASIIWAKNYSAPKLTVTVKNYRMPFKNNPFFPSSVKTDNGTFYKKEVFSNSQSCGVSGCHEGIKRQWEDSTHFRTPNFFVQAVEREMLRANKNGFLFKETGAYKKN